MVAEVIDRLGIGKIDLVANDSGGAIAQIFAAHFPDRLNSLVLTNCDVHDGWPPPQVLPVIERARSGALAPVFQPLIDRPDLARERYARGESVPLFRAYADPSVLTDEIIRLYLQPLLSSPQRIEAFRNYWLAFDNTHTVAIHSALRILKTPTLIVWGLDDFFFDRKWAHWLKNTIPGARRIVEVEDARLFFAEDRPDALSGAILDFWDELEAAWVSRDQRYSTNFARPYASKKRRRRQAVCDGRRRRGGGPASNFPVVTAASAFALHCFADQCADSRCHGHRQRAPVSFSALA